jgi:farnesyl-diphosphate farnesyltransferase
MNPNDSVESKKLSIGISGGGGQHMQDVDTPRTCEPKTGSPEIWRSDATKEESLHEHLLEGVSRTFAFTIPQLPSGLRETVTNAYLLCRIADTIEDDPSLDAESKDGFHAAFLEAAESGRGARTFARTLWPRLAPGTLEAEIELIRKSPEVLRMTRLLRPGQREAILRCLTTMSRGMGHFERSRSRSGLQDIAEYEHYCYFVAGVVGEMLTDLFCDHSPLIEARRGDLEARAVSFGLGLQMTNILKDVWDDFSGGVCWLPRGVFEANGYELGDLQPQHNGNGEAFAASIRELVGVAHAHLRQALDYTLTIPNHEIGIRRFLIWAALLAVSTLRKIDADPLFTSGDQVKVSRRRVAAIVATSNVVIRSNRGLGAVFNAAARGLPLAESNGSSTPSGDDPTSQ